MLSELEGRLWSIHWECHFADNLNLMHIFNHERRARVEAALGRQLALSLQMERRKKGSNYKHINDHGSFM